MATKVTDRATTDHTTVLTRENTTTSDVQG